MAEEITNAKHPEEGVLFGGQPSEAQIAELAEAGYGTIIDLRGEGEARGFDQAAAVEAAGMEYVTIPFTADTLPSGQPFADFIEAFRDAERPVVVHCASGNRVGGAYYAWLVDEKGMDRAEASEKAQEAGLRSAQIEAAANRWLDQQ